MIRRWLALTYYLYALRLAALSHFYFNRLYTVAQNKNNAALPRLCRFRQPEKLPHL
nr:hypothetical protein [uncultured Kingella sp.]